MGRGPVTCTPFSLKKRMPSSMGRAARLSPAVKVTESASAGARMSAMRRVVALSFTWIWMGEVIFFGRGAMDM